MAPVDGLYGTEEAVCTPEALKAGSKRAAVKTPPDDPWAVEFPDSPDSPEQGRKIDTKPEQKAKAKPQSLKKNGRGVPIITHTIRSQERRAEDRKDDESPKALTWASRLMTTPGTAKSDHSNTSGTKPPAKTEAKVASNNDSEGNSGSDIAAIVKEETLVPQNRRRKEDNSGYAVTK